MTLKSADVTNPVSIQDKVQSSVKSEELDMKFRKKNQVCGFIPHL